MMFLYDKEQLLTAYIEEERENAIQNGKREMVNLMLTNGMKDTDIASMLKMNLKDFHEWLENE